MKEKEIFKHRKKFRPSHEGRLYAEIVGRYGVQDPGVKSYFETIKDHLEDKESLEFFYDAFYDRLTEIGKFKVPMRY